MLELTASLAISLLKLTMQTIEYPIVDKMLRDLNSALDLAESHGLLCGLLCASPSVTDAHWFSHIFPAHDNVELAKPEVEQALSRLHVQAKSAIVDEELAFQLMLPDEHDDLLTRTEALAAWCRGYVFGLGEGGVSKHTSLPSNTGELLTDLVQISQVGFEEDGDMAEQEDAFIELEEYVRVAVMLINEELTPMREATRNRPLH